MLASWVRSRIKVSESLKAVLKEEGNHQEVLLRELSGALLSEIAELESARSEPESNEALLDELGERGVHKVLVNRVARRLRTSGSAQKAEAREERARKSGHEAAYVSPPRVSKQKEEEEGFRSSRTSPPPADVDIEAFELNETIRQERGQLEGWVEQAKLSGRERQVYELDMQTDFDTNTIACELNIPANKVRDYRSRYLAKFKRAAGL